MNDPLLGREILGQFVVRRRLGDGGMGSVYLAEQPSVGRNAAVKVLHPHLCRDREVASRFGLEARAAASLASPHVVSIYAHGALPDGTLFLAMEYLDGPTLKELLEREGRLSRERAIGVALQVAEALEEAHGRGIVHRDLKPANVMLVRRGSDPDFVKVLDFGVAKITGVDLTSTDRIVGTPAYMSPEQLRGEPLDGRSDIYSLGIVLYEMLAGRLPFRAETPAGFMHKHLTERPPRLSASVPDLAPHVRLDDVLQRLLAKDRELRPANAAELSRELREALSASPVPAGGGETLSIAAPASLTARGRLHPGARAGLLALAALSVVALAAVSFVALRGRGPGSIEPRPVVAPSAPVPTPALAGAGAEVPAPAARVPPVAAKAATPILAAAAVPGRVRPTAPVAVEEPPGPAPVPASATGGESLEEMERKFEGVLSRLRLPPSGRSQARDAYRAQKAAYASATVRELHSRAFLLQMLETYDQPQMRLLPGDDRPLPELTDLLLTARMKTPMDADARRLLLDGATRAYDDASTRDEDREFFKRLALASILRASLEDPSVLESPGARR